MKLAIHFAFAVLLALPASDSRACGYHDDVTIARGFLNWVYPESLHVIGAISAATADKRLAFREIAAFDPLGLQYREMVKALTRFAELLGASPDQAPPMSFALVLIEPMLWTQFEPGTEGLRAQPHVSGPQPGQLVLVSGQNVIHAIANGELGIAEAHRLGLIRLYGSEQQIAAILYVVSHIGRQQSDVKDQIRRTAEPQSRAAATSTQ